MKQEEFNQDNQPKINLEGIELPLFNIPTNEEETSSFRNLINVESLPTNFVNKLEEEELNSEDRTLNPLCVELPEKDEYLRKKKYLGEFFLEEDKAEARANLGITPLLAELKAIIEAKLVDETGNLKFGLEPTSGAENEEAYGQVLSSAIIYNTLQKYYTKNELDSQSDSIFRLINELKNTKINAERVYTKEEVDNILFSELFITRLENIAREKVSQGLATVAETGDYNDLINTPTKLSLFLNDSKYLIREDVIGSEGFISDIEQLREQAEKGQQAYNKFISKVDIDDLNDIVKTILDKAESAYQLPETGIPKEDLSNNVLNSLDKADTAYLLPSTGISRNDLSEDVLNSLNEADSLILDVSNKLNIIQDLDNIRQGATLGSTAYLLPNTGISKLDLSQGVLSSLEHADSIYDSFDEKADKVSNATDGNFAGLNSLGNLIDLNCKPGDFQPKGNYKITLEEVQDPSSDGAGISFIDRISQNTNGVITPHKKNVQNASSNQDGLMSSNHYSKLEGIENGSLVNIIEHISINGNEITPNNKSINLGQHYVLDENYIHTDNNFTSNLKNKLNNVESNAQVNILEGVKVNGTELNIDSNKKVDITITTQNSNNNNSNGTIVVNNSEVSVKGLNNAAYENVASSISDNDSGLVRANMVKNHIDPKFKSITDLIPNEATTSNLLADKEFVNSSIATATADFKGTYNLKSDLELNISATQANINTKIKSKVSNANNNDYVFILIPTDNNTPAEISHVDRYKYDGTNWVYEFTLNNSSFTAALWAAINSGITTNLVIKLTNLPDNTDLNNSLNNKVSNISYDTTNKKLTKTINGTTSDIVLASTIVTDGGGIKSHLTVTDNNPSLTWGTKSKVATIGSTAINVTMPSNPNTTYTITTGESNGQIKVTPSSGSAYNVDVKGLGARAYDSTNYLPLTGGTISGQINLPRDSAISNGAGGYGHYLLNWTGTDTIVSSYQGPTYVRSSDTDNLYHRVGLSTDYLILDTNNYSTYALPRSGGSVTSSININYSNADFTKADNDVSSTLYPGFFIRDKNGKLTGRLFTSVQSNGKLITYFYSNNYDTSGNSVGEMYLGQEITKDGTKKWVLSDAASFRTALGLGSNATSSTDYLPLSGGTLTGTLNIESNFVFTKGGTDQNRTFSFKRTNNNCNIDIGWDWTNKDGSGAFFRSVDDTTPAGSGGGAFGFFARNSSATKQLIGQATGSLTWDDNDILHSGNYSSYALPLSGGTMTGDIDLATNTKGIVLATASSWTNSDRSIPFSANTLEGTIRYYKTGFSYNPNKDTLKVGGNIVWHAGNDGSGSGLDADLLDGQHGSYYATASSVSTLQGYFTNGIAENANKLDNNTSDWYMKRGAAYTSSNTGTYWQKVATCSIEGSGTHDTSLTLIVSEHYSRNGSGILVLNGRKNSGASAVNTDYTKAYWVCRDNIVKPDEFVLTAKIESSTKTTFNLYKKQTSSWKVSRFAMLDEGTWSDKSNLWTLLTATGTNENSYSAIPSDETQFVSVDYSAASQLQTSRSLWGQSFDGTTDISGNISNVGNITPSATVSKNLGSDTLMFEYGYIRRLNTQSGYNLRLGAAGVEYIQIGADSGNVSISSAVSMASTLTVTGNTTVSGVFNNTGISSGTANAARPIWYSYYNSGSGTVAKGRPVVSDDFTYNPSTKVLSVGSVSGSLSGNATSATLLQNEGTTSGTTAITTTSSSWSMQKTRSGFTNLEIVWGQGWNKKGQTYTPSGGSATNSTDTGNLILYLSKSDTSNEQALNMQIDGLFYAAGGFYGNVIGNCSGSAGSVAWNNITGKPSTFEPSSHTHDYLYTTQVSQLLDNVTWAVNYAKDYRKAFIYNNNGLEYSYLFGLSKTNTVINNENCATYGAILKMGYADRYLRMIRIHAGCWYNTSGTKNSTAGDTTNVNWEKIYAGYADSAGKATNDSDGNAINNTYLKNSGGTITGNLDIKGYLSLLTKSSDSLTDPNLDLVIQGFGYKTDSDTVKAWHIYSYQGINLNPAGIGYMPIVFGSAYPNTGGLCFTGSKSYSGTTYDNYWGINIDDPQYLLHVNGSFGASSGTITGVFGALRIKRDTNDYSAIKFLGSTDTTLGFIGVNPDKQPIFTLDANTIYKIWHAGNDGTGSELDADKLDGAHGSEFYSLSGNNTIAINNNDDLNDYNTAGTFTTSGGSTGSTVATSLLNKPTFSGGFRMYVNSLSSGNNYVRQRIITSGGKIFDRYSNSNGEFTDKIWREIAYTDSNIASATKLQTVRSIWGQNFDGTNDVNGHIIFNNSMGVYGYNNPDSGNAELLSILYLYSNNNLRLGYGTSGKGYSTYIYGGDVSLSYGTSRTTGLFLSSSGNVGIGNTVPSYKLHVSGTFRTSSDASIGGNLEVSKAIERYYNTASDSPMIALTSNNFDVWLWRINSGSSISTTTSNVAGFGLKYIGTGTGVNNNLVLYADNLKSDSTYGAQVAAITINQAGTVKFASTPNVNGTNVSLVGHKHAYTDLTGSSTTANQAIVSSGTANGWTLKTLGSNAFNSTSYLPLSGGTVTNFIYFRSALTTGDTTHIGAAIGIIPKLGNPVDGDTTSKKAGIGFLYDRPNVSSNDTLTGISISAGGSTNWYEKAGGLFITSSEITWQNNKVWHAGNDGSGSGLDADKLDGYHAIGEGIGNIIKQGYINITATTEEKWYKIATIPTSSYMSNILLNISTLYMYGQYAECLVSIGARTTSSYYFHTINGIAGNIPANSVRLYYNTYSDGLEVYFKAPVSTTNNRTVVTKVIAESGRSEHLLDLITLEKGTTIEPTSGWSYVEMTYVDYLGNALTATSLKTTRTIWGRNFDGTADITGNLTLNNNTYIYSKDSGGTSRLVLGLNAQNVLLLGYETASAGYNTIIDGNNIYFRYGTSRTNGLFLNSSGNIGIGNTAPATKLHVSGTTTTNTLAIGDTTATAHLSFARGSYNYIHAATAGGIIGFVTNGKTVGLASNIDLLILDGAVSVKGTLSTTGDISVVKTSGASKILSLNSNGKIELLTDTNRGVYDRTAGRWLIVTNGTNSWIPAGNVAIGTSANTTYKLYVEGTNGNGKCAAENFYTTSDRSKKENIKQYSEHISKFTLKGTKKDAYGVIALDVPEMFREGEEGNYTVNYNSILSYYVGLLENKNKLLELRISSLESKVKQLKEGINYG